MIVVIQKILNMKVTHTHYGGHAPDCMSSASLNISNLVNGYDAYHLAHQSTALSTEAVKS